MPFSAIRLAGWLSATILGGWISAPADSGNSSWLTYAWQSDDGLPNNYVTGLAQTPDGYLWVATFSRPARFDGIRFEEFFPKDFAGAANQKITALQLSRRGGLWMGTSHGQAIFLNSKSATVFAKGFPDKVVQAMVEDEDGALWIAYLSGAVCRLKDGKIASFGVQDGLPPYEEHNPNVCSLACDTQGQIWFAKSGQIGIFRQEHFETLLQLHSITAYVASARDGGIWICSDHQLIKFSVGKSPENCGTFEPKNADAEPSVLLEDHEGGVWIGTSDSGLFHYDGSHFENIPTSGDRITSLTQDREGNIWAGTGNCGLDRIRPRTVELETAETGLPSGTVESLSEDVHGVWSTTQNGLLLRCQNGVWSTISANPKWPGGRATCVTADGKGAVWIGTKEHALYRWSDGNFTRWTHADGVVGREIHALLVDRNGDLWIGEEKPDIVQRLHDGKLETFPMPADIRIIRTMTEDIAGNIWIGTSGGSLIRISKGVVTDETSRTTGQQLSIRCLRATADGSLWIGYADDGLGWLKDGRFGRISAEQGFPDDSISQIIAGDPGWLWFGGDHGIFKARQDDLEFLAAGRAAKVNYLRYGQSEGLFSLEANCGDSPGALRSQDGRLWIPMQTALAIINPNRLSGDLPPPPVLLKKVVVDDQTVASYGGVMPVRNGIDLQHPQAQLRLPPDHRRLEFEFSALSFSAPENIRFQYRLEGFDDHWIDGGTQRSASYSRLTAGKYLFRVKACNSYGIWNKKGAALAFTVAPFFWQTWWFRLAALAMFTSLTAMTVRYISSRRVRMKLKLLEQQAALDKERARIARDIHDDLGSYLTEIVMLSEFALQDGSEPEKANKHLVEALATARQGIKSLDETVWAVNPRNDTLPHLIDYIGHFALQFLQRAGIRCRVDLPDHPTELTVPAAMRHNLFLAVKETLNNVVRHSGATEVEVGIKTARDLLRITITDNGQGFGRVQNDACADGLRNMRQRMEEIGGEFNIESAPGAGTRVLLMVSIPNRRNGVYANHSFHN